MLGSGGCESINNTQLHKKAKHIFSHNKIHVLTMSSSWAGSGDSVVAHLLGEVFRERSEQTRELADSSFPPFSPRLPQHRGSNARHGDTDTFHQRAPQTLK